MHKCDIFCEEHSFFELIVSSDEHSFLCISHCKKNAFVQKGFSKLWKKVFLSEASVSILQDTFWWFYFEHFEVIS